MRCLPRMRWKRTRGNARLIAVDNPFDAATPAYAAVRPAYPEDALDILCVPGVHTAADIGAGTGKMTRLLLERGLTVHAVEPADAMRRQIGNAPTASSLTVHATRAEDTGLPDASVDLVVYAQSWHWVDPRDAAAEAARILSPEGRLAAVWNQMDVSHPWVHRLTRIMRSGDVHRPDRPPQFGDGFSDPQLTLIRWDDRVTPEELLDLGTTRSSYLRSTPAGQEKMQDNLRWYLYEHLGYAPGQQIILPYSTLVWVSTPKRGAEA